MAKLKTAPNDLSVTEFLQTVPDASKRADAIQLLQIMGHITQEEPVMWGTSIIGFGTYQHLYTGGRTGEWFLTGFSPRKQYMSVYLMGGLGQFEDLLPLLGPHKTGKGCLYFKRLSDLNEDVFKQMVIRGVDNLQDKRL